VVDCQKQQEKATAKAKANRKPLHYARNEEKKVVIAVAKNMISLEFMLLACMIEEAPALTSSLT